MIKVTSYLISKKLAEIGFWGNCDTIFWYDKNGNLDYDQVGITLTREQQAEATLAYDLETILTALPKRISRGKDYSDYKLTLSHSDVAYEMKYGTWEESIISRNPGESLADCAARLLILLVETGIIKFNKEEK